MITAMQEAIEAEASAQGAPFTGEFTVRANDFGGVDFAQGSWRVVRFCQEDRGAGQLDVLVMSGRGTVVARGMVHLDLEAAPRVAVQLAIALFEAVRHA